MLLLENSIHYYFFRDLTEDYCVNAVGLPADDHFVQM